MKGADCVFSGEIFFGGRHDDIYQVVAWMAPGLYVDIGAAAGRITRRLAELSPTSRIVAFEPFTGNHPHFARNTEGLPNVTLIKAAAGRANGAAHLYVGTTLSGRERGWEGYAGYSSAGMLLTETDPRRESGKTEDVEVRTIDETVAEPVRLLKIDVQGSEIEVLQGARRTITQHGIDVIYVEFSGERDVLGFLYEHGYLVLDSGLYVYTPREGEDPSALSPFFSVSTVSSGRQVLRGPISARPLLAEDYVAMFGGRRLQTDLVAIHKSSFPQLLRAAAARLEDLGAKPRP